MREWVLAHNLPVFTVVTKIDHVPKSKVQNVVSAIEKEFGGVVLPFSAVDRKYCEKVLEYMLELCR